MAAIVGFIIPIAELYATLGTGTISGTVTDVDGNFLKRKIMLYRNQEEDAYSTTFSSLVDGTYSFSVRDGGNDRWRVVSQSVADDENSASFDRVQGG